MAQHIHCTVENCYYWDTGNYCLAKEILVTSDSEASSAPEHVDAGNMMEVAAEIGSTSAPTCMATCCKTFHDRSRSSSPPVPKLSRTEVTQGAQKNQG
ncbi:MAG: DUF1540 domain-containing protein [Limnochordia bacterium]